ncbi:MULTISPECIES: MBL fold metallo-hydrolase [Enterobacterales]|uniref:MBL fold metallo-hydrolase n=1 Tax=Enterobacterales TaxID=91347 RepID=UPI00190311DB|nr:MBL fold metallo-hydrolase [Citrobacter koseri]MBJ8866073.1 MBL fold metallo-hydrolase [Citrobacter koseri]MBL4562460.1 MBL fold metallo-hydrolase [Citrobacter koseri]
MKRYLIRALIVLSIAILLLAGAGYLYLQRPLFGMLPGEEQARQFEHYSPNYHDGHFVNQIPSPIHTNGSTEWSIWKEELFGNKGQPRPDSPLPNLKTDLKALDIQQDLFVWLGHSSFYIQLAGKRILIDPVLSEYASPVPIINRAFAGTNIYKADDIPPIDILLISHDHYDHLDYTTIKALQQGVKEVMTGLGVGTHFQAWGYPENIVHEADWYDSIQVGNVAITATPARHFSGRTLSRDQSQWVGYVIKSTDRTLFISGDSGYGPHFEEIGKRFGPFDWVALDSGQYDPRWANVHMSPEEALQAARDLHAKAFTPDHIGRFSLAPHDWNDPMRRIIKNNTFGHALWTPVIGQPVYFNRPPTHYSPWWDPK